MPMRHHAMRIGELAQAAGVSARTIRYYIVEGLLPPPDGAGLGASYDQTHLDRLRLIRHLKDTYLPLREIRRQLTGLDDAAVRARLAEIDRERPDADPAGKADAIPGAPSQPTGHSPTSASLITAQAIPARGLVRSEDPATPRRLPPPEPDRPVAPRDPGYSLPGSEQKVGVATPLAAPMPPPDTPVNIATDDMAAENWIRLKLGDDVELLVRSGAYHRLRDRIDWLAGWARAIFH